MNITLLIFTCQGKEHLLPACYTSFKKNCNYSFYKTVLAVDGKIDESVIEVIQPDGIIQNYHRKGYIHSILNALSQVETEFFFWLEDDFDFKQTIDIEKLSSDLLAHPNWAQIILCRHAPLSTEERKNLIVHPYYQLETPFSASPVLCRTNYIKEGFAAIKKVSKNELTKLTGFENFLSDYFNKNNILCALLDPGEIPHLTHVGLLESTAREYHMINSLETKNSDIGKNYISGFGDSRKIGIFNKLKMTFTLSLAFIKLLFSQFISREVYDYALRIVIASKKGFRN